MKYVFLSLICLFIICSAYSQSYIIPGTIVLETGDTLKGFIHDKQWSKNPSSILFQTGLSSAPKEFLAKDIKYFSTVRPVEYVKLPIEYDGSKLTNNTNIGLEPIRIVKDTALLEVVVKGGISLLYMVDQYGRGHYFLHELNTEPKELLNRDTRSINDNNIMLSADLPFRKDLFRKINTCRELQAKIEVARYNRSTLKSIVEALNPCNGYTVVQPPPTQITKRKPEVGVVFQGFITDLSFDENTDFAYAPYSNLNFGGGITYEIFSRKKPDRTSFYNELKYQSTDSEGYDIYGRALTMKLTYVRLVNMIRLSYPVKNSHLFWNFGIINGYRLSSDISRMPPITADYENGLENGVTLGAGGKKALGKVKASLMINYEFETGVFDSGPFRKSKNLGFSVGIQF